MVASTSVLACLAYVVFARRVQLRSGRTSSTGLLTTPTDVEMLLSFNNPASVFNVQRTCNSFSADPSRDLRHPARHAGVSMGASKNSPRDRHQQTPLERDTLSLLFTSPVLRVDLGAALPDGTLESLEESVLHSWQDHMEEQAKLPEPKRKRATDEMQRQRATTDQERNEEFFYFQKQKYGVSGHASAPNPDGWLASEAAQELIGAMTAAASGYIERIAHHAGLDKVRSWDMEDWELDPDKMHVWASIHQGGSTHPRHIHMGAVISGVFYVRAPPGAGQICFFDPRGSVPPFEREIRHEPRAGDLLLFPPWLGHSVASSATDGPRISISFNYVDDELEGGRYGWGEATAGLDVVPLERNLGLDPQRDVEDEESEQSMDGRWEDDAQKASESDVHLHLADICSTLGSDNLRAALLEHVEAEQSDSKQAELQNLCSLLDRIKHASSDLLSEFDGSRKRMDD